MRTRRSGDRPRDEREPRARSTRLQDEPESTLGRKPAEVTQEELAGAGSSRREEAGEPGGERGP